MHKMTALVGAQGQTWLEYARRLKSSLITQDKWELRKAYVASGRRH